MRILFKKGVTVIEIVVGVAILGTALVFISFTFTLFFNASGTVLEKTKALYLAEEGQEVIRYIRDENWNHITGLTIDTTYYLSLSTTTLATSTSAEVIDGVYTRSFIIENAFRDVNNDLVSSTTSGALVDSGSRMVRVQVTWGSGEMIQLESLLTNLHNI